MFPSYMGQFMGKTANNSLAVNCSMTFSFIMITGQIIPVTQMGLSKVPQYNMGTFFSVAAAFRRARSWNVDT